MGQSESKQQGKKKFIVLYGPTGSGKGTVYKEYLKKSLSCTDVDEKCLLNHKYFIGEVDKYVENDKDYQKLIQNLDAESDKILEISKKIKKIDTKSENDKKTVLSSVKKSIKLDNQIDILEKQLKQLKKLKLADKMTEIYFNIRNSKNYNIQNELDVLDHMHKGYNIIYEITGTNSSTIQKICDDNLFELSISKMDSKNKEKYGNTSIQKDYDIIVLVPFTTYKKLASRIMKRFIKAKTSGKSARLVPIDAKKLSNDEEQSFNNLVQLITNKCVDKVIVYDNNDDVNQVVIESVEIMPRVGTDPSCILKNKLKESITSKSFSDFILKICKET